ncbi:uncharacterized protein LOC126368282 [Pectinophora gossypiella]|uniref:uncharacterized protein LOC126368282 n=1 Tax=Pectinophora gossypiella TaxID=13191 RepID=UPI00214EAED4|nr:uncharacterized protein LOC126368282 [Pectinophora gossypiella]
MFLVKKSNLSDRPIFNLKMLNNYLAHFKFRLINIQKIPDFLQEGDWAVKIDLTQAYFHVPIAKSHQSFLRVLYKTESTLELLQMTCLPFGLSSAPKAFSTMSNWVAQLLRQKGLRVIVYLDDYLIVNQDRHILESQAAEAIEILTRLGLTINYPKSVLTPTRCLDYLGITWNLSTNSKYLPVEKVQKMRSKLLSVLKSRQWCLKDAQRIMGMLNFASFVVHRGRLHCRPIQMASALLTKAKPQRKFPLDRLASIEMSWWVDALTSCTSIHRQTTDHFLTTDASAKGWGAVLDGNPLSGIWLSEQQRWHSNLKEMWAIIQTIRNSHHHLKNASILLQSDNKSVVTYIKNEGGLRSKSLYHLTIALFQLLDKNNIRIVPQYIPGQFNIEADRLSRRKVQGEWSLTQEACQEIFDRFGQPHIDLFASKNAHVLSRYVSRDFSDLNAEFHDAFSEDWDYLKAWVFPPPHLMPRVLAHLNKARGMYTIIAPRWHKVYWRPDLKRIAVRAPITITNLRHRLKDTRTGRPPALVDQMCLEAWLVKGGINNLRTGLRTRSIY